MKSHAKIYISCLLILYTFNAFAQNKVTLASLLQEMVDPSSVAQWPDPFYSTKQASSYDRRSISPDEPGWFANSDNSQYIRIEDVMGRTENVMLDEDGPGAIVRFWLTTFKRNGILRIYLDHQKEPVIEIPAYDLMKSGLMLGKALLNPHSSYEPKEKGGSTLYLPIPYAQHCKITFEDLEKEKQPRYYQINYRTYAKGTKVETFDHKNLSAIKSQIEAVDSILLQPSVPQGKQLSVNETLKAQNEVTLVLPKGSAAIHQLTFDIATEDKKDYAQVLRSVILKISFDGQETVWCPLADFSGSGVGGNSIQSWYRTVNKEGKVISRWVMPYKEKAVITLINLGDIDVESSIKATVKKWKWDDNSMYFHTGFKQIKNAPITNEYDANTVLEWSQINIKGKGIYLGNTLAIYNHMHTWYGEGDQKIWVDKEAWPSEYGTGTEDYYNTSWAPVVLYQTPFANAPRADNEDSFGHNTFTRTRNLDGVTFKEYFKFDLEMLGWDIGTADFAATSYWYGFAGAIDDSDKIEKGKDLLLPSEGHNK